MFQKVWNNIENLIHNTYFKIKNNNIKNIQSSKKMSQASKIKIDNFKKALLIKKDALKTNKSNKVKKYTKMEIQEIINKMRNKNKKHAATVQHTLNISQLFIELEKKALSLSIISSVKKKIIDAYQEIQHTSI
ncbi:hypothetical protein D9V80_00315 [Buchnera aphidicola (Thelaxes californica)]|uniref:Uncharacterized protein n=1 Tax=Buchnera aphidicola (Thelaxes californica) TaxID=1315998 RepID=A0A4D6YKW2_9GAMM|nr:flagellar hook-basal body complex protein FliE [Buchnera aphidicola]QCI26614.1 hypothetical protein D9V80_00315 [Buchnera aphidicola (Thelaxes californica)]